MGMKGKGASAEKNTYNTPKMKIGVGVITNKGFGGGKKMGELIGAKKISKKGK